MIIYFINYLNNKINEYKKTNRNRNKPNYYRLFLFWLSLIILITAIFYILGLFEKNLVELKLQPEFEQNNLSPNIQINNSSPNIKSKDNNLDSTISLNNVSDISKSKLCTDILNSVSKIPKPLNFVDDYNFET